MLPIFYPAILITALFFFSGIEKILFFSRSSGKFAKKMAIPLTLAQLIIIAVIALEIAAPSAIVAYLGTGLATLVPFYKPAVLALMAFTKIPSLYVQKNLRNLRSIT